MLQLKTNVFFDKASDYNWESLNESIFLDIFFNSLHNLMGDAFLNYQYYILSSHDKNVVPHSSQLNIKNKILIFISDETSFVPYSLQTKYFAIFKCYLPFELPNSNIFPFNLGYVRDVVAYPEIEINKRQFNVFFSGNLNYNRISLYRNLHKIFSYCPDIVVKYLISFIIRLSLTSLLKSNFDAVIPKSYIRFTDGFKKGLNASDYSEMLRNSKIVLCPKGFSSPETFRHIEAIRSGAIVISESLPNTHFYRDAPFIIASDWREGIEIANKLIYDNKKMHELQEKSLVWWHNVCNEDSTAKYVRDKIISLENHIHKNC